MLFFIPKAIPCLFFIFPGTDNLIIEFQIDAIVFITPHFIQSIAIKLYQTVEFILIIIYFTQEYYMIAYAGHQFDFPVAQYVNLLNLSIPELILLQKYSKLI